MAVTTTEPMPRSMPDMGKINGFSGLTVTVTKHPQARNSPGAMVVPTGRMSVDQLLQLHTQLPLHNGPGWYKFTVNDAGGGGGEDTWTTRLGVDPQENTMAGPFPPVPPQGPMAVGMPTTLAEGVRQIGPGYFYDENLGTLVTPWREIVQWRPGEPLPKAPTGAAATPLQSVPLNANPWNWPPQQQGWGGYPVEDSNTKRLEAQLAEERRQRAEEALRHDMQRQAEETNRRMEAQQQQFAALIERLTAKPAGPSETEQRMERELAEERRRREANEQDARRRDEERLREERHRTEMTAMNDKFDRMIREMSSNKTDPMLPMLLQMFTAQQAQATEAVKAIQGAMSTAASASERQTQQMVAQLSSSVMSPIQLMQLMQQSQGAGAEGARTLVGAMREAMETQKAVFQQLLDVASEGGQPAWVSVVSQALDKASVIGTALAERSERQAQQPVVQQRPVQYVQRPTNGVVRTAGGGIPQPAMTTGAPAIAAAQPVQDANFTGDRPPGTEYDAAKEEFVLSNGQRISVADVTRDGWRKSLAELQKRATHTFPPAPLPVVAPGAPASVISVFPQAPPVPVGFNGAPAVEPAPGAAPLAIVKPKPPKRGKKMKPPADPASYTAREMRDVPPEAVREAIAPWDDATLFGPILLPHVEKLRATVPLPPPADVAKNIIEARTQLEAAGQVPPVMALFDALQFEVLADRLFPGVDEQYLILVVEALEEATGTTDEEEDDSDE